MGSMSASDSKKGTSLESTRGSSDSGDRLSLSALRSQFTKSNTQSLSQSQMTSARFRNEERLRSDIRRERRLRQQAINERVIAMQDNLAKEMAVQHELTLDGLERELREQMETELAELEKDALTKEESKLRSEYEVRLNRKIETLQSS